jgi:hypothetical protein
MGLPAAVAVFVVGTAVATPVLVILYWASTCYAARRRRDLFFSRVQD